MKIFQKFRSHHSQFLPSARSMATAPSSFFEHTFTNDLSFKSRHKKHKCFRIMDEEGEVISPEYDESLLATPLLLDVFTVMVRLREADQIFNQAQRMGTISFYMTSHGEEGSVVGSAAALKFTDPIFPQYREQGALMWRGFTIQDMAYQLAQTRHDRGKARQMPVHYGDASKNIVTISSPLATQIPQASGAGYHYRIKGEDKVAVTYFGDGSASEGDFHSAMNFAATLNSQTLFYCRNNMYAISTPVDDQYAGDGIAARGLAYGIQTQRIDGNDALAAFTATHRARERIIENRAPALIESMSYRQGDHSTSDFSKLYRDEEEMKKWSELIAKLGNPIYRLEKHLIKRGAIKEGYRAEIEQETKGLVREGLAQAKKELHPHIDTLFEDVYATVPPHLSEQKKDLYAHLAEYGQHYNIDKYEK